MRQIIEKLYFDWSRTKTTSVQAKGLTALLNRQAKITEGQKVSGITRCIWPTTVKTDSRRLTRRMWMS